MPVSRREFLSLAVLVTAGAALWKFIQVSLQSLVPRRPAGQFGGEFDLGPLSNLPAAGMPPQDFPDGRFTLVHGERGLLALSKACTHLDCLVSWDASRERFVCPCHGSDFTLEGHCQRGPATRALDTYPIRLVGTDGKVQRSTTPDGSPLALTGVDEAALPDLRVVVDTGSRIRRDIYAG